MIAQVSEQKLVSESQEKAGTLSNWSSANILGTVQEFQTQDQWKEIDHTTVDLSTL